MKKMMKVAWCKHCGGAFAYAMHPYPMPSISGGFISECAALREVVDTFMSYDDYLREGHRVTIVEHNPKQLLDCRCSPDKYVVPCP